MKTSRDSQPSNGQSRYTNRQGLLKHLIKNKVDINTRATYLGIYDLFQTLSNEKEERMQNSEWDGLLIFFGHDKEKSPLTINGIECEKVNKNYSIHTSEGRERLLKDYLKHNLAIRLNQYSGIIEGVKEDISVDATTVAREQDLIPFYGKVSPAVFGYDEQARKIEKTKLTDLMRKANPNYQETDTFGKRHLTVSSASYEDPNATFAAYSRETGIGVFVKAGEIEFSGLKSEPVPYTPPRSHVPLEKITAPQYAHV